MSNENKLIYPTVDLFVYDLAQGMGQDEEKISQNRQLFWKKIYGDKISAAQLEQLKQAETETADYIELLGDKQVEKFESNLDGYSYPVKLLNDTYAAIFDFSGEIEIDEDNKFKPKEIDCLESLKKEVISRVNPAATIGQSLLVSGQLTANDQDALKTAQTCYSQLNLVPNAKWERDLKADGQFLGADFYELWLPPGDGNIGQNYHVLICLFPHNSGESFDVIKEKITKLYPHFLRLFAYRNKVIWAYTQSRLKAELKGYSEKIQQIVDRLPAQVNAPKVDLNELQQSLVNSRTIFSVYANYISRLEEKENTIKTNLKNYDKRLKTIGEKMGSGGEAFKFMKSFSDFAQERYVWQVEADNRSLSAELRLLENAIQTIEGISEIERAKSDRALNVTIGTVGVGIGISGVYASTYASQIKSTASAQKSMDVNAVFWSSICWGIVASAIVFALIKIIGKNWR